MSSNNVAFDEALSDAKSDEDLMPTIERAIKNVKSAVDNLEIEFHVADDAVATIQHYANELLDAAKALEQYEPYLEHYERLREHF